MNFDEFWGWWFETTKIGKIISRETPASTWGILLDSKKTFQVGPLTQQNWRLCRSGATNSSVKKIAIFCPDMITHISCLRIYISRIAMLCFDSVSFCAAKHMSKVTWFHKIENRMFHFFEFLMCLIWYKEYCGEIHMTFLMFWNSKSQSFSKHVLHHVFCSGGTCSTVPNETHWKVLGGLWGPVWALLWVLWVRFCQMKPMVSKNLPLVFNIFR